jgi:hypothetical protein
LYFMAYRIIIHTLNPVLFGRYNVWKNLSVALTVRTVWSWLWIDHGCLVPLFTHIQSQGIDFIQFSFRWINCLLMRELSIKNVIRMWDTYLVRSPPKAFGFFIHAIHSIHLFIFVGGRTRWFLRLSYLRLCCISCKMVRSLTQTRFSRYYDISPISPNKRLDGERDGNFA